MDHPIQWTVAAPLWPEVLPAPGAAIGELASPALLRFASDSFMDDLLAVLERDPAKTRAFVARYETWRGMPKPSEADNLLEAELPLAGQARKLKQKNVARRGLGFLPLGRAADASSAGAAVPPRKLLKLYQSAHQRYYLVTSSLVCKVAGFPDRRPDPGKQERAGFVMRRLLPPGPVDPKADLPAVDLETWEEYAFVGTPHGPGWRKIGRHREEAVRSYLPGEELLPLFPLGYREEDGRRRNLFAGLVPVGRREAYLGAPKQVVIPAGEGSGAGTPRTQAASPKTARMALFRTQVAESWKRLIEIAFAAKGQADESITNGNAIDAAKTIQSARDQIQIGSWLILLEFADYLQEYLPDVWAQIMLPAPTGGVTPLLQALERSVFDNAAVTALTAATTYSLSQLMRSLRDALAAIKGGRPFSETNAKALRDRLEKATGKFDRSGAHEEWPDFLFPLADPEHPWQPVITAVPDLGEIDGVDVSRPLEEGPADPALLRQRRDSIDKLVALVVRALPSETDQDVPAVPLAAQPILDHRDGWFVIRCVFDRPACGPLHDAVVSDPTQPFQLAGFFDPDAPARPIRIALPIDTTAAGIRKFNKNTAFMISDVLCGQVQRAKSMSFGDLVRSVLPWPLHKDLSGTEAGPCKAQGDPALSLGMICSLSIPIITICAFILLMIIVSLLDIIFRWTPWFITCFPLPGFRAKR